MKCAYDDVDRTRLLELMLELRRFSVAVAGQSMDTTVRQYEAGEQASALRRALTALDSLR